MRFPRILFAVPMLVAGIALPAVGRDPGPPPTDTIGMGHEMFMQESVTVHRGHTLTMLNDSRWIHIIGPGVNGILVDDPRVPIKVRQLMETNSVYTTGAWNTLGTFNVTCSVHPEMNIKVTVVA